MTSAGSFPRLPSSLLQDSGLNTPNSLSSTIGGTPKEPMLANENLPDILCIPILERAVIDCVYIYFKYWEGFTITRLKLLEFQMALIADEYTKMLEWLQSVQFANICSYLRYDVDITRNTMTDAMHNPKTAHRLAALYDIRIPDYKRTITGVLSALLLFGFFVLPGRAAGTNGISAPIPGRFTQLDPVLDATIADQPKAEIHMALPPAGSSSILKSDGSFELIHNLRSLVGKKINRIPVIAGKAQKIKYYNVPIYTYVTTTGAKEDLPVKVKGVKNAMPSPTMAKLKVWGKKLDVLMPFVSAAGSIAQIFTAFHK